ncbi:amino acid adenylation domain-containing protein [Actinomadura sp. NAK00032]|uniref:non-ribosomal peptide synthetase n=1 Tax=Actinomadura sp. NAK00032 TaxID=2742128 RepID=UPI001591E202|nr:non-ribosomal peptide synthetase [Actinomadura sp. NAK00032]QKW37587.1 amino acid adenylation domain-containing protein [Actinomadura sp. NAK00032]
MAQDLLNELHRRGIKLRVTDGRLDVLAPTGSLTPELRASLRASRDELLDLLRRGESEEAPPEIAPRPEERYEPFPLTDIQHAYWVGRGSAVELGGVSTHLYFELDAEGLDAARLNASLRKVIDRHDMLRAVVQPDGRQRVLRDVPAYEIRVTDAADLSPARRDEVTAALRAEMDHRAPAADAWPLFDIRAVATGPGRLRLFFSFDIMILDGLSLYLLFQDWRRFYEEPGWTPEPLELSYRDFVLGEERAREGDRYKRAEEYWLDRLETLPPAPALPLATRPAQLAHTRFTRRAARLPEERWTAVKRTARAHGVTPSAVLMSAFAEVLRQWSAQPDFTLNLTLFNRPPAHPQIDRVIGDFTTLTMLEVRDDAEASFAGRAGRVQRQLMRDMEHLAYSGVRVQRERSRRLGSGPTAAMPIVFTSALVFGTPDHDPSEGIRFFGEQVHGLTQTPQVWLDHQVSEEDGELAYNWDTVDGLFPAGLLDDMFAVYNALLDRLAADEDAWERPGPLAALPAWQADERRRANAPAPATAGGPGHAVPEADATLCGLVEARAARTPGATAVVDSAGEHTYAEIVASGRRLARRLRELGAVPNTLVGVVMDKGWEQVAGVVGVTASGAAYLPIDPQWPEARRADLLEQGAVGIVVTTPRLRDALGWPPGVRVVTFADAEVRAAGAGPLPEPPAPGDLAYVIFTSGSTGRPKGVMIDHRGAVGTVAEINRRFRVGPADRVLALSALSFDLSVYDVFGTLAAGGAVVMPAPDRHHDPSHWTELVRRHGVTVWNSVPALMQAWTDAQVRTDGAADSTLRLALLSGDWIPVSLPDAVRALHPRAEVVSLGGATEASIWSVCYPIGEVPAEWSSIPYGKPLRGQTLHVLDGGFRPRPVWSTGEILIGGAGVARGYWADPERTAERFVTHPETGERLYRTGDLGRYLPGGDIEFLGREDHQVKINGYRIELGEINAALERRPDVGESVVTVRAEPRTGRRQLVAYVVPPDRGEGAGTAAGGGDAPALDGAPVQGGWDAAVAAGNTELARVAAELDADLSRYREVWRAVERLCPPVMARTLARLGLFRSAGEAATSADIVGRHGIKPVYGDLVERWMAVLAAEGYLAGTGSAGEFRCERPLDAEELDRTVREGLDAIEAGDGERALLGYFSACAERQEELLRGEVSPLSLLLPGGDSAVTDALYSGNPVSRLQNRIAAKAAGAFCRRAAAGDERTVRILEVGAGTGATAAEVFAELPAEGVRYSFTDVSKYFCQRARARFGDRGFVDYAVFDIDRPPGDQGVAPGSVDLVIAANVMHDAADLDQSLRHLRSVLAPGGLLLLIEGTENSLQQLVTVGFLEGLAKGHGDGEGPLLPVPRWRDLAGAAGFARFGSIPDGPAVVDVHVQHVLAALAPAGRPRPDAGRLRGGLAELLPEYMVPRHYVFVDRLPLSANGKVDPSALPLPWDQESAADLVAPRDDMERTLFGIWSDALGHEDFGVEDSFFELGADSLHAVSIIDRLRDEAGLEVTAEEGLELLFDNPTIGELATAVRERIAAP